MSTAQPADGEVADEHGPGEEVREEAEAEQPAQRAQRSGDDREGSRQGGRSGGPRQVGNGRRLWIPGRVDVVERLERDRLLPAIVFVFSRVGCDAAVRQCLDANLRLTTPAERDEVIEFVEGACRHLSTDGRKSFTASTLYDADGRVVASAKHTWIQVDPSVFN